MSKQVSVHNHECNSPCEHADICYLVNGKHSDKRISPDAIEKVLNKLSDKKVYYSGCNLVDIAANFNSKVINDSNRQITFSKNNLEQMTMVCGDDAKHFKDSVQLTVYSQEDIIEPLTADMQKMFLIKDEETYLTAYRILQASKSNHKIHFPIEHTWAAENKDKVVTLIGMWNACTNPAISLDSCLENYIYNNKCVYADDYIDLRYDGTVRRCPFSDESHPINYDNPAAMFEIPFTPKCIWHEMFYKEE